MMYVITEPCIDVLDRTCVEKCPVEAIFYEDDVPAQWSAFTPINPRFFTDLLPGQPAPLDSPGGAAKLGRVGADTPLVAGYPSRG